jgi:3-isopropylmalate/(R)-2-methylmalate dehydratase small subunit
MTSSQSPVLKQCSGRSVDAVSSVRVAFAAPVGLLSAASTLRKCTFASPGFHSPVPLGMRPFASRCRLSTVVMKTMADVCKVGKKRTGPVITADVFVVRDNIDTDQIIPAEYLTLVPSNAEEYEKLGSYALIGLPDEANPTRYVDDGAVQTKYPIVIAGENFGCGSSREHAPIAIGACGGCAVIAQSYARIFFRNCSATGELYPWESVNRLCDHFETGQSASIDFDNNQVTNNVTGKVFQLRPLGDVLPVVDAGGIFEFARASGMIAKHQSPSASVHG